jgi:hypothetical protein
VHQHDLGLEESWVTTDCYFRLVTTLIGLSVTDAWKLADYHGIINFGKQEDNCMSIMRFAGSVGNQGHVVLLHKLISILLLIFHMKA